MVVEYYLTGLNDWSHHLYEIVGGVESVMGVADLD